MNNISPTEVKWKRLIWEGAEKFLALSCFPNLTKWPLSTFILKSSLCHTNKFSVSFDITILHPLYEFRVASFILLQNSLARKCWMEDKITHEFGDCIFWSKSRWKWDERTCRWNVEVSTQVIWDIGTWYFCCCRAWSFCSSWIIGNFQLHNMLVLLINCYAKITSPTPVHWRHFICF